MAAAASQEVSSVSLASVQSDPSVHSFALEQRKRSIGYHYQVDVELPSDGKLGIIANRCTWQIFSVVFYCASPMATDLNGKGGLEFLCFSLSFSQFKKPSLAIPESSRSLA